jgi:hypothetical protein
MINSKIILRTVSFAVVFDFPTSLYFLQILSYNSLAVTDSITTTTNNLKKKIFNLSEYKLKASKLFFSVPHVRFILFDMKILQ